MVLDVGNKIMMAPHTGKLLADRNSLFQQSGNYWMKCHDWMQAAAQLINRMRVPVKKWHVLNLPK